MRRARKIASYLASLALFLGSFCVPARAQQDQPTIRFVRNPEAAPDFSLSGLDGKPVALAPTRGKVVLVNFWATWCGPCRAEVPDLVRLQTKYKDRLQIVGLVVDDDDLDAVEGFAKKFGINYPVAVATGEVRMKYGGVAALPTSFVLDTEGRIVQKHEGLRNPVLYEVEIRALLGLPIEGVRVETFEDKGEIFLKHADRATELPGVDMSKLTPEQKMAALHQFNAESCTCGCQFTLAQCRIYDSACAVSQKVTAKIVAEVGSRAAKSAQPAAPAGQQPAAPGPAASPSPSPDPPNHF
jgi:thiol-disulfide isomerase/thioredoxin